MKEPGAARHRLKNWLAQCAEGHGSAVVFPVLLFAIVLALQAGSGAFSAEFSAPDEPAHFVTALMLRDYLRAGLPLHPLAFASNYYLHYPKVAFGHWPPVFHLVEALWMLVWPVSRASVLVLLAFQTWFLAATVYRTAGARFTHWGGMAIALLFILLPVTQFSTDRVLADGLVALFDFWAVLFWARYMSRRGQWDAVGFGLMASLSMLTKGNGIAVLAVPLIATVIARRGAILKSRGFWIALGLPAAIGGPWQFVTWTILKSSNALGGAPVARLLSYCALLATETGVVVLAFAALGFVDVVRRSWTEDSDGSFWSAVAALPPAVLLFHAVVPLEPESRYLLGAMPAMVLLAGRGLVYAARHLAPRRIARRWSIAVLTICTATAFGIGTFTILKKHHYGYEEIAQRFAMRTDCERCVILTSSPGDGDGMLIAEVAMHDRRPGHYVLRADKVLARSDWDGGHYELQYDSVDQVNQFLLSVPVDTVVIDLSRGDGLPHQKLLLDAMNRHPETWRLAGKASGVRRLGGPGEIVVYESTSHRGPEEPRNINVDMKYSLGKTLSLK